MAEVHSNGKQQNGDEAKDKQAGQHEDDKAILTATKQSSEDIAIEQLVATEASTCPALLCRHTPI